MAMVFSDQDSRECKRLKQKTSKTYPAYTYRSPKFQCHLPLLCYWFSLNLWSWSTMDCGWVHRVWLPRPLIVQSVPKQSSFIGSLLSTRVSAAHLSEVRAHKFLKDKRAKQI